MSEAPEQQKKEKKLRAEIREKVTGYIGAALGLVAGLAWNDAIISLIDTVIEVERNSVLAKFLYALALTLLLVIATSYFVKFFRQKSEE